MVSPVCLLKCARVGALDRENMVKNMVKLTRVLRKVQPSIRLYRTFCLIKQLPSVKLMDGRDGRAPITRDFILDLGL